MPRERRRPRPLAELPDAAWRRIEGVLTDIDDTLTSDGVLSDPVRACLERLRAAGIAVVPVTGRPAGRAIEVARTWPVDAVVGENGACYGWRTPEGLDIRYALKEATRRDHLARMQAIAEEIVRAVPRARPAADQGQRASDLAIDYAEHVSPRLAPAEVERVLGILKAHGMRTTLSSIHIHGWWGDYDKLTTSRRCVAERFGRPLTQDRWLYVGDAPNDAPMFAWFPLAIGVANVMDMIEAIDPPPAYVTKGRSAEGFLEMAERLLAARGEGAREGR